MLRSRENGSAGIDLRLLQAAVEATGEAILITTADLDEPGPVIVYANPAFTKLSGYDAAEAVGRSPRFLQGEGTERTALDRTRASLEAGEAFQGEALNYRKDGTAYRVEWLITPVREATAASRTGSRRSATSPSAAPARTGRRCWCASCTTG